MPFDGLTTERTAELEALLRMREMLAKPGGWCQGGAYRDEGRCLIQAAASATDSVILLYHVTRRLAAELPRAQRWSPLALLQPSLAMVRFNDRPSTTQADVVALIDRAIGAAT